MRRQYAFTLIEVIVTIVVIAVAAAALFGVFTSLVRGSADPVIQQQATTIAEAYLEEISLRAFSDPQGFESGTTEGESGRDEYDDVQDYRNLTPVPTAPADQFGTAIPALSQYRVSVSITNAGLNGIAAADSLRIDVTVNHPAIAPITLSGFRTNY